MERRANILVMVVDGLRADRLGCYGYSGGATPVMDALAAAGCRAESCSTVATAAPAAWAALLTGMHPVSLGLTSERGGRQLPLGTDVLVQPFLRTGYSTCCFDNLRRQYHWLGEGFEQYVDPGVRYGRGATAPEMTARLVPWLRTHRNEDFLLWVRFTDLHAEATNGTADYDASLRRVDQHIGRVLQTLDELRLSQRTIVVAVGSCGWGLGEHGNRGAAGLQQAAIRVPLLIRHPGIAAGSVLKTNVSICDVAPTLLQTAGFEAPSGIDGSSFWGDLRSTASGDNREPLPVYDGSNPLRWSCSGDGYKVVITRSEAGEVIHRQLFQPDLDPAEENDIALLQPELARKMAEELTDWINQRLAQWTAMEELMEEV